MAQLLWEKQALIFICKLPWDKVKNDLDLEYSHTSWTELVVCIYQLSGHQLQNFLKIHYFQSYLYKIGF